MTSIPGMGMTLGVSGIAMQPARPAGTGAAPDAVAPGFPLAETPFSTAGDLPLAPETGDPTSMTAPGPDFPAWFPTWRSLPAPDPQLQERLMAGQRPPPAGKGMPPRIPVVPIPLPAADSRGPAPGASPVAPAAAAGTVATPDVRAGSEARVSAAELRPGSLPPPLAAASASPTDAASPRTPSEIVARLPESAGYPPAPILPPLRRHSLPVSQGAAPVDPASRPAVAEPATLVASTAVRLASAVAQNGEDPATVRPDGSALEMAGSGAGAARHAPGPDAGILSAATITQPSAPGAPGITASQQHLPERVGSEEWAEAVAQRLSQLAESPQARANIRLNPPQLGPMQIEVHVDGDRAVVQLAVHHDATRDALEQAMPKLRAQLESSGFASIDVSVSRNPHRERPGAQPYGEAGLPADDELPSPVAGSRQASVARLLDAYA